MTPEDFHDELDAHIAESMTDPEYRAAHVAALGIRDADCGCCKIVDAVALRSLLESLDTLDALRSDHV